MQNRFCSRRGTECVPLLTFTVSVLLSGALGCGGTARETSGVSGAGGSTLGSAGTSQNSAGHGSDSAGASSGGSSSGGNSSGSGGDSGLGGSSNTGGASGYGGNSSLGGNGAGGTASGDGCAMIDNENACKARSDCTAIYKTLLCPGSGAPCPTVFAYCSNSGCGPACSAGSICVSQLIEGGARIEPGDGGTCPVGEHLSGGACMRDPDYTCKPLPTACGSAVNCACAQSLCAGTCQSASATQINCVEAVP